MTPDLHTAREPRSRTVFRHTEEAFRATGMTMQAFASKVADEYQARVAAPERIVEFHVGTTVDTIVKAEKANLQIVTRFLRGMVKLPTDLEESWIAALPQPHRADCERELARRYGFLGARTQMSATAARTLCTAALAIEFGHLLQEVAQVMADNQVCAADLPALNRAMKEAQDLEAELATMKATISSAIQELAPRAAGAPSVRAIG
jgi:hypothetical protein